MMRFPMKLNYKMLIGGALAIAAALPTFAGKPAPTYPMLVEFVDAGQNLRSDSGDPDFPVSYRHGEGEVLAELRSNDGRLQMTTCYTPPNQVDVVCSRGLQIDFRSPVGSTSAPIYGLPAGWPGPFVTSISLLPIDDQGALLPGGLRDVMTEVGEVRRARMVVNFYTASSLTGTEVQYTLRFKPSGPAGDTFIWPDSDFVQVTYQGGSLNCSAPSAQGVNGCAAWEVEAADPDDVGALTSDNQWDEGDFHMPLKFRISVLPPAEGDGGGGKGGGPKK